MVIRYTNLQLTNGEETENDFSRSGLKGNRIPPSSLHSIASYLAMFAPALPEFFIERYSKEGDLVMDPFSGRGTTALRAREKSRKFIGSDLNPYAFVLSKFKTSNVMKNDILNRINELENLYEVWSNNNKNIHRRVAYKELLYFYSPSALKSLIYLRDKIGINWRESSDIDIAILAFATGIMHGPSKKDGSSIYFSLDMSNSISMSPNYVRKFANEKGLVKPKGAVFDKLINRIESRFDDKIMMNKFDGNVFEQDATKPNPNVKDDSVDLVVTSPPYLSIVNYTNANWLKLWLLGYERKSLKKDIVLSDKLKLKEYIPFITNVLNALEPKLKSGAHVCLIVGDVKDTKLIESVWEKISSIVNYDFVEVYYDMGYSQNKKVLNTMNKRKGKATMIEKIMVVRKR